MNCSCTIFSILITVWILHPFITIECQKVELHDRDLSEALKDISTTVTTLDLSNNNLSVLHNNTFSIFSHLAELWLQNNYISMIEDGAFNNLSSLARLDLSNNRLKRVPLLPDSVHVIWLQLSGNTAMSHIDTKYLTKLTKLQAVAWKNNMAKLTTAFPKMPNLKFINLGGNDILYKNSELFRGCTALSILRLDGCNLTRLFDFGGIEANITTLFLASNRLYHFPDIREFVSLIKIDLSTNYISFVPIELVVHLQTGTIILNDNPIISVTELCWFWTSDWPFEIIISDPMASILQTSSQEMLCEGKYYLQYMNVFFNDDFVCQPFTNAPMISEITFTAYKCYCYDSSTSAVTKSLGT